MTDYMLSQKMHQKYLKKAEEDEVRLTSFLKIYVGADIWETGVISLLCECYSLTDQLLQLLGSLGPTRNEQTKTEEHFLTAESAMKLGILLSGIAACKADLHQKNISLLKH